MARKKQKSGSNVDNTQRMSNKQRQNLDPMWKIILRECQTSKDIVDNYRSMCEFRISAGAVEKQPSTGKLDAYISSWSYDVEGRAKKCVERSCELANKSTQQLHRVATPCLDDHQFKEEGIGSVGELSKVCSQIFSNGCMWPVLADLTLCGP